MCNAEGSENNLCNVDSGHCYCKPNIGGDNCEKCIDGFFGFPTCQGVFCYYLLNLDLTPFRPLLQNDYPVLTCLRFSSVSN